MTKYFNFVLTESQVDFLAESKNGVNIMKVLTVLLIHTCTDSGYNYARPVMEFLFTFRSDVNIRCRAC